MGDSGCHGLAQTLQWRVIAREPASARQVFSDLKFDIGAQVRQGFSLAIDREPPIELGPVVDGRLFRVGVVGNLEGSVAGTLPIRIGAGLNRLAAELEQVGRPVRTAATSVDERINVLAVPLVGTLQGYQKTIAEPPVVDTHCDEPTDQLLQRQAAIQRRLTQHGVPVRAATRGPRSAKARSVCAF